MLLGAGPRYELCRHEGDMLNEKSKLGGIANQNMSTKLTPTEHGFGLRIELALEAVIRELGVT